MKRGQLETLPITVPLTADMLNLAKIAKAAGVNVFTLHRWRRHKRIKIKIASGGQVTITPVSVPLSP